MNKGEAVVSPRVAIRSVRTERVRKSPVEVCAYIMIPIA